MSLIDQIPYLSTLPKTAQIAVLALLALALSIIAAWTVRFILARIVMVWARRLVQRTEHDLDDRILEALDRPLRVIAIGVGIALVATLFQFTTDLDRLSDSLASSLLIAGIMIFLYRLVDIVSLTSETLRYVTGLQIEERLLPFMRTLTKIVILVLGLLIIIGEFGYDVTALVASFGVVGLAVSLAAKDTAANVFGFTAIVSDNPFEVGDFIVTGDFSGTVEHVGVRSTRVRKLDQSLVTVPNSKLTDAAVTNWSRLSKRRLDFIIGLTYNTSSDQMRVVLHQIREMLKARETLDTESVIVHFVNFGDSSLDIRIIASVLIADWSEYTAEVELINLAIMDIVEKLGLGMAFPSRSLYIESFHRDEPEAQPIPKHLIPKAETGQAAEKFQDNPAESSDSDGDEGDAE